MANNLTIRTVPAKSSGLVLNLFILSLFLGCISWVSLDWFLGEIGTGNPVGWKPVFPIVYLEVSWKCPLKTNPINVSKSELPITIPLKIPWHSGWWFEPTPLKNMTDFVSCQLGWWNSIFHSQLYMESHNPVHGSSHQLFQSPVPWIPWARATRRTKAGRWTCRFSPPDIPLGGSFPRHPTRYPTGPADGTGSKA